MPDDTGAAWPSPPPPLSSEADFQVRYRYMQSYVAAVAQAALAMSPEYLDWYIEQGQHTESVAPILDPTLYRERGEALHQDIGLAIHLRDYRRKLVDDGVPDPFLHQMSDQ